MPGSGQPLIGLWTYLIWPAENGGVWREKPAATSIGVIGIGSEKQPNAEKQRSLAIWRLAVSKAGNRRGGWPGVMA